MGFLTKEAILAADDLKKEVVDIEEWGGSVGVRTMTAAERDVYESSLISRDSAGNMITDTRNMRAKLVALTLVDEAGARLFTETEIEALTAKSADVMHRLSEVAQRLNGMGAKAVETAEKNSEAAPSGSPSSN